ncbi:RiPP maturation radical SAM protein 1 [Kibdelosporangium aridum]|uniref:RiPP maturation radical SAM protein 1 n=1 Tax=Kibdelosporangium aridum TaxID=2030 RepID=A0A428ZIE2_KIBAR|nr:RiPP maturation radical SAM C-methyltransferase [Kibdelosporangium aridum]RSM87873.1 RiPP maturation radical SAM protein 1 [Kibdelosporangium aridum]
MPRTTLVCMPWHALSRPSLALGVLSSACRREGLSPPVEYHGGLRFAEFLLDRTDGVVTPFDYAAVAETGFPHALGDWVFAGVVNGDDFGLDGMVDYAARHGIAMRTLRSMRDLAAPFVELVVDEVLATDPELVGFSTTFMQNVPSLAVAKQLKHRKPELTVLLGGGNCDGPMGAALYREFEFVDMVLRGEADETFPRLLRALDGDGEVTEVPGLCWRDTINPARLVPPARMSAPNFEGWFGAFDASVVSRYVEPELVVESARGCWWGEHHHCTFCGLNGTSMAFRAKPAVTFVAEVDGLVRQHQVLDVMVVDNILAPGYLRTALPELASRGWDLRLHYEVKANLTGAQIEVLRDAGVYSVQPGIESLVDDVLARMNKGVRAVRNVRTLRDCESAGLTVAWNWLYGFPGEREEDYKAVIDQLPALVHLQPPDGVTRIQLERFSPYFEDPSLGFPDRSPAEAYQYVYALPPETLQDLVYLFDTSPRGLTEHQAGPLWMAIETWTVWYATSTLVRKHIDGVTVLRDRRAGWPEEDHVLEDPREQRAWAELECGRSAVGVARRLADVGLRWSVNDLQRWLSELCERGLLFTEGGYYIALATTSAAPR